MATIRRCRSLGATLLLALLATGCQARIAADVRVRGDGSGVVTAGVGLDDEALKQVGDLGALIAVDDLRVAGWSITGPAKEGDGLTWLRASRPFANVGQANQIMGSLSGDAGPFRELGLTRQTSSWNTTIRLRGRVDLGAGLVGLADADLRARLAEFGFDPGLDLEGLKARFGPDVAENLKVTFSARLPGEVKANGSAQNGAAQNGNRVTWTAAVGRETVVSADAEVSRIPRVPVVMGAAGFVVVLVLVVVARRRKHRRRRVWR